MLPITAAGTPQAEGAGRMRVGILGSGLMGGKLGTLLARSGHEAVFSYSRRHEKLQRLAVDAGRNARAGTPREVVQAADAILQPARSPGRLRWRAKSQKGNTMTQGEGQS